MNDVANAFRKYNNITVLHAPDILPLLKGMSRIAKIKLLTRFAYAAWLSTQSKKEFNKRRYRLYWESVACEVDSEDKKPVYMKREEIHFIGSDCATHIQKSV